MIDIKKIRKSLGLTQEEFAKEIGVDRRTIINYEKGETIPDSKVKLIHFLIESKNNSTLEVFEKTIVPSGVPYYDVDFTSSFIEVENSQSMQPTSYISHPFFLGCDIVVRNSGQSMAKLIAHGDAVGLVRVINWRDFLPLGEVYAIVTTNNFRMIKIITKGDDKDHYTLLSKPSDNKKDEFPPQQINKKHILHIFKVQASSHLF